MHLLLVPTVSELRALVLIKLIVIFQGNSRMLVHIAQSWVKASQWWPNLAASSTEAGEGGANREGGRGREPGESRQRLLALSGASTAALPALRCLVTAEGTLPELWCWQKQGSKPWAVSLLCSSDTAHSRWFCPSQDLSPRPLWPKAC